MKKDLFSALLPLGAALYFACPHLVGEALDPEVTVAILERLLPQSVEISASSGMIVCLTGREKKVCRGLRVERRPPRNFLVSWPDGSSQRLERLQVCPALGDSPLRVKVPGFPAREYLGALTVDGGMAALQLLNTLKLEDYLLGVVGAEMELVPEALKCQAMVSRTYALFNAGRHRSRGYDFCDTTHCQYYRGLSGMNPQIRAAIDQTLGLVFYFREKLAAVFCHSTCGGTTNAADAAWGGRVIPYLQPVDDKGACRSSPHYRWQAQVDGSELLRILSAAAQRQVQGLQIEKTARSGWVRTLALKCSGGGKRVVSGEWLHLVLGRALGWNTFKSGNFTVARSGERWLFSGRGLGHGVGLCQFGAVHLARQGMDFRQIARFYFPGTEIGVIRNR